MRREIFSKEKPKRENGKCECVCITLMIEEWFFRVGRKSKTYAASEHFSWLLFCFNRGSTFHSPSHARIHEWAISNVLVPFVRQIFLLDQVKRAVEPFSMVNKTIFFLLFFCKENLKFFNFSLMAKEIHLQSALSL